MDIGKPERVIHIEPAEEPVPAPVREPVPAPQPEVVPDPVTV